MMTKAMRELLAQREAVAAKAREAIENGTAADVKAAREELEDINNRIEALRALEAEEEREFENSRPRGEQKEREELKNEYKSVFVKALRRKRLNADERNIIRDYKRTFYNVMHEGGVVTDPDGDSSLIVPEDVQTTINTIMRQLNDLTQYVRQETTTMLSGSRVLEADEEMIPMAVVDEYGEINELDNPKFTPVTYKLVKRAGFLPITNELLADTDQNILAYVSNWIARKVVVTRNVLVRNKLDELDKVPLADINDLKRVLNVDLDPAISASAIILTNQDGFHFLDTLQDNDGRPLLQPDPTNATQRLFKGRPIVVMSNRHLPTVDEKAPMIVGNLQQLIVHFWRGMFELSSTTEGGEAWRRDSTELRVITRDDVVLWDEAAAVYGQIDLSTP